MKTAPKQPRGRVPRTYLVLDPSIDFEILPSPERGLVAMPVTVRAFIDFWLLQKQLRVFLGRYVGELYRGTIRRYLGQVRGRIDAHSAALVRQISGALDNTAEVNVMEVAVNADYYTTLLHYPPQGFLP